MSFNPLMLAQIRPLWEKFKGNHRSELDSLKEAVKNNIATGATMTVTVAGPDGETSTTELTLTDEDIALIDSVRKMFG